MTKGGDFGLWAGISSDGRHGWLIPLQPDTGLPVSPRRSLRAIFHEEVETRETLDDGETARTVYLWLARAEELSPGVLQDVVSQPMPAPATHLPGDVLVDPAALDLPFQVLLLHRGFALVQGLTELPPDLTGGRVELWPMMDVAGAPEAEVSAVPAVALAGMLLAEYAVMEQDALKRFGLWLHKPRRGSWVTSRVSSKIGVVTEITGPSGWVVQWEGSPLLESVVPDQVTICGWAPL